MRYVIGIVVFIVLVYFCLCLALFVFQRSLIYFPQPNFNNSAGSTLQLATDGGDVLVSTRPHIGPNALIYFGGNAEEVALNLPAFSSAFPDYALYLMHYRGYNGSAGAPSEQALFDDARKLFDLVHAAHANIVVIGKSLGSGVAVNLTSQRPASKLILITPYDSLQALAEREYPYFPVRWLLRDKFESWRYAQQIRVPTMLVAAEHDEVIPASSTAQLHARFGTGVATLKVIPATGHNTLSASPHYLEILRSAL